MVSKRNVSIQLIRAVAMFMIIFDHLLLRIEFPMKSIVLQICNSGVFIFLLISGFLYGNKKIENWKRWFVNRIVKICVPMWLFMVIDFIVEALLWNYFDIKMVLVYAFNLQGIFGVNIAGASLWFLTLIMICYLITPLLQWVKQKDFNRNVGIAAIITGIIVQIVLAYTTDIGMVAGHTLSWCVIAIGMYVIGYFWGNLILSDNTKKGHIAIVTVLMIISSGVVLLFNTMYDGQIIYDRIVIFYGMIVIDFWICIVLYKLGQYVNSKWIRNVINNLDVISYEFYIVHELLILSITLNVLKNNGVVAYMLSTLVLSYVTAVIFHKICGCIINCVLIYKKH